MGRREENRERTRQRLSDASFELFRTHGFEATRVQDIVAAAGVSQATFFNYYPTKTAVLEARAAESAALYAALVRHELDRADATTASRLDTIVTVIAAELELDVEAARLVATRTNLFFGADTGDFEQIHVSQGLLIELFALGQASGEIDDRADPKQLAELFTAVVTLTTTNWLTGWWGDDREPLGQRLLAAVHLLVDGIGAPTKRRRSPS